MQLIEYRILNYSTALKQPGVAARVQTGGSQRVPRDPEGDVLRYGCADAVDVLARLRRVGGDAGILIDAIPGSCAIRA